MKTFGILRSRGVAVKSCVLAVSLAGSAAANAALPDWAAGIGADLSTAVTDAATMVGPVVALSIGTVIIFKLIKRFSNKV